MGQQWPTIWDWVNCALAILGVLMAGQPFFQMIYGRPSRMLKQSSGATGRGA